MGGVPVGHDQQIGLFRIPALTAVPLGQGGLEHRFGLGDERPVPGQQAQPPGQRFSRGDGRGGDGQHVGAMVPVPLGVVVLVVEHIEVALGDRPLIRPGEPPDLLARHPGRVLVHALRPPAPPLAVGRVALRIAKGAGIDRGVVMMRDCGGIGSDAAGGGVGASAGFPAGDPDRGRPGRVQEPATVHPGLPTRRRVGHHDLLSSWEDRIDLAVARSRRTGTAWRTGGPSAPWWRPTLHCDDVEARTVRNLPSCSEVITGPATARRLSCSRDSVAAACTALVAARRSWSSSTRREKSTLPPWIAAIARSCPGSARLLPLTWSARSRPPGIGTITDPLRKRTETAIRTSRPRRTGSCVGTA